MPQRACNDCGEMADDAKAFCPACGHAFVAEKTRSEESQFQKMDGTMQLGQTMYNQMLSDMGLNLKPAAGKKHKVPEVKASLRPIEPARPDPADLAAPPEEGSHKLLIFGLVGAFLILGLLLLIAGALFIWSRT